MSLRRFLFVILLLWFCAPVGAQRAALRVMEWNVENLFDCNHDTLRNDLEFLPDGERRWTWGRYWRKMKDVARVVLAVGEDQPADLVGLCEVENDTVMRDLTERGILRSLGYRYVMTDSRDSRGVDVALMYQPARFRLLDWHAVALPSEQHGYRPTRDILWAKGQTMSGDTLHVVVCHLPSRLGGSQADGHRRLAAQTLAQLADSIGRDKHILVMGDFNAAPRDAVFRELNGLRDKAPRKRRPKEGTYRYRGLWSWIDHMLVSPSLEGRTSALHLYTAPWLQDADANGGWHPRRTFLGPSYHGGVSDHVAIWMDVSL